MDIPLTAVEKVIYLAEVPFFRGMTVEQLRILADVCEEEFTPAEARIFNEGDPGGVLYVVVSGRVGIEQTKNARFACAARHGRGRRLPGRDRLLRRQSPQQLGHRHPGHADAAVAPRAVDCAGPDSTPTCRSS